MGHSLGHTHIVIAGAGVIGLACALELRLRGLQVTVCDAGQAMHESSWAAGGMLAVHDPENPPALLPLALFSRGLYPTFLAQVARLSGSPVPLRTRTTLQLTDRGTHPEGRSLSLRQAQQYVPGLCAPDGVYILLEEASLDPRDLCAALPLAARAAGVVIYEHEAVRSLAPQPGQVRVQTARRELVADHFVNCCGAWSSELSPAARVVPRKGQMLAVSAPGLESVVRSREVYMIPRGDGRVAIGATVEDAGFSKTVEPAALEQLQRRAARLWPPLADAPVLESWAGLRPATEDGLPVLGAKNPAAAQWIATGHFRNGILLAPGTAAVLTASILSHMGEPVERPPLDLTAFAPHRVLHPASCDNRFAPAL